MAAQYAFVIPVLDEEASITSLLDLLRERFAGAEIIVVDGGSADDTVVRAMPLCDQLLLGRRGRAAQMNLGAAASDAHYLLFLHADTRPDFCLADMQAALQDSPPWGFCPVRLSGAGWSFRVIERFMNWRSRVTRVATGDQMLFLERELLQRCGGFADVPLMEDVALCKQLRRFAAPRILPRPVITSSRRWEEHGVLRTVLRMWLLRLAYFLGVSPGRLWRYYHGGRYG